MIDLYQTSKFCRRLSIKIGEDRGLYPRNILENYTLSFVYPVDKLPIVKKRIQTGS